jgi:hypothetical protein
VASHIVSDLLYVARHVDSSLLITQYSGGIAACSIKVRHGVCYCICLWTESSVTEQLGEQSFCQQQLPSLSPKIFRVGYGSSTTILSGITNLRVYDCLVCNMLA